MTITLTKTVTPSPCGDSPLDPLRPSGSSPLKRGQLENAGQCSLDSSIAEVANQKELSPFKGDERRNEETERRGYDIAKPKLTSASSLTLALRKLMECKAPDGRYLVTRKVHWQAVYRVLVDEGWYDASLGYAAFVEYIRSVAPPGGFRIMPDVETIRHISQTLYARPFAKWRYDAAYHTKRWAYERMRAVAEAFLSCLGEEKNDNISQ